jgi:hypothetical protein
MHNDCEQMGTSRAAQIARWLLCVAAVESDYTTDGSDARTLVQTLWTLADGKYSFLHTACTRVILQMCTRANIANDAFTQYVWPVVGGADSAFNNVALAKPGHIWICAEPFARVRVRSVHAHTRFSEQRRAYTIV